MARLCPERIQSEIETLWAEGPSGPPGEFITRLLALIVERTGYGDELRAAAFSDAVNRGREALFSAREPRAFRREALALVAACDQQFDRLSQYASEREAGFAEIIDLLTRAMHDLMGDSTTFTTTVLDESERIVDIVRSSDIDEIKRQVSERVGTIRQVVAEKQERDTQAHAKLSRQVEILQTRLVEAKNEASLDALTGIANRRTFDRTLLRWAQGRGTRGMPFVLALLDIDHFKLINDAHGHTIGDRVLLALAEKLNGAVRRTDLVARYGGEEFALLYANARLDEIERRLNELLRHIAAATYEYEEGGERRTVQFTVTCGVAEHAIGEAPEDLIRRADAALYEGKRSGRNRVVAARR